ncbi:MAG: ABC transporter substrate-binding protein [Clostridia bacterium]|nr:ABC transporter substrate-binding protein [Clostridia bacterium]
MKNLFRSLLALILALTMLLGAASCAAADGEKSANIAVTSAVDTLNPLRTDATEIVKYATSLVFLPLVELNADLEFVPQLAESITTDDNLTFTIKLRDDAVWSDGTPVTSRDVEFTLLLITSPECFYAWLSQNIIVGTDDNTGLAPQGATSLEGVKIVDEKTLTVTAKWPVALYTFENILGRYLFPLPEHVLGDIPRDQLLTHEWFFNPTVISGPYFVEKYDPNHYVYYVANENYFQGAPIIKRLNMNVVDPAQVLAGLQAGEIDLVQPTTGSLLLEDYEAVNALSSVKGVKSTPVTNQCIFFNTQKVTDVRIRQAIACGLDRQTILDGLVLGYGEIVDAFLCSASPYYSEELGVTVYDPARAAELVKAAKADGASTDLVWYVNSADSTFVNASAYIAATLHEIGLNIEVKTVELPMLMEVAGSGEFDVLTVEYTLAPVDPYTDMAWLLSEGGWTHYATADTAANLSLTQTSTDQDEVRKAYLAVNREVQTNVPMISCYIVSKLGVVSNRLINAHPDVFGTFINVHEWDIQ